MLWQSYRVAKQKLQRDKSDEMQNPNCSWKVKNRNFEKKRFCCCSTVSNWLNKRQPTEFLNHINLWSCGMHDLVVVEIKTTVSKNSQGKKKWENIIEQQLMLLYFISAFFHFRSLLSFYNAFCQCLVGFQSAGGVSRGLPVNWTNYSANNREN